MKHFEWRALHADDTAARTQLFRASVSGSFESAGFQMFAEETVLRNGVSLGRFRMRKPLDAAHT
jgi:hypothetical protein